MDLNRSVKGHLVSGVIGLDAFVPIGRGPVRRVFVVQKIPGWHGESLPTASGWPIAEILIWPCERISSEGVDTCFWSSKLEWYMSTFSCLISGLFELFISSVLPWGFFRFSWSWGLIAQRCMPLKDWTKKPCSYRDFHPSQQRLNNKSVMAGLQLGIPRQVMFFGLCGGRRRALWYIDVYSLFFSIFRDTMRMVHVPWTAWRLEMPRTHAPVLFRFMAYHVRIPDPRSKKRAQCH